MGITPSYIFEPTANMANFYYCLRKLRPTWARAYGKLSIFVLVNYGQHGKLFFDTMANAEVASSILATPFGVVCRVYLFPPVMPGAIIGIALRANVVRNKKYCIGVLCVLPEGQPQ
jgi:hypothetical protein